MRYWVGAKFADRARPKRGHLSYRYRRVGFSAGGGLNSYDDPTPTATDTCKHTPKVLGYVFLRRSILPRTPQQRSITDKSCRVARYLMFLHAYSHKTSHMYVTKRRDG